MTVPSGNKTIFAVRNIVLSLYDNKKKKIIFMVFPTEHQEIQEFHNPKHFRATVLPH
jgi:hypothetical protein